METLLYALYVASGKDVKLTERGIIYVDEIDKISRKAKDASISRDVSGEGVQQAMLKLLEGTLVSFPRDGNTKSARGEVIQVNTKNILFICGGAFAGIENVIFDKLSSRLNDGQGEAGNKENIVNSLSKLNSMRKDKSILKFVDSNDLTQFGLIPEFIGRYATSPILGCY